MNRAPDADWLSPFDFLPGFEDDPEEKAAAARHKEILRGIRVTLAMLPDGTTPEEVTALKAKMVTRLQAQGYEDAEQIVKEAYPN